MYFLVVSDKIPKLWPEESFKKHRCEPFAQKLSDKSLENLEDLGSNILCSGGNIGHSITSHDVCILVCIQI